MRFLATLVAVTNSQPMIESLTSLTLALQRQASKEHHRRDVFCLMGSSYEAQAVTKNPVAVENKEFSESGTITIQDPRP